MKRMWMLTAIAAWTLLPAVADVASAQEPTPRARTRVRPRVESRPFTWTFSDSRPRIGVLVDTKADTAADRIGARIEAVTPGGPADEAGVKAGDVITRFNGTALAGARTDDDDDHGQSGPGLKLIDLARELEPGDTVQIEYRRGNDTRRATIVAEDLGWAQAFGPQMRQLEEMMPRVRGMMPGGFSYFGGPWGGIEMVKLNPDLGEYFGTREGVLVVKAPEDSSLALKSGDVILAIGGRKPSSPEQAMRILRSYDTGETVALDVLRKQKRVTVSWKVPERDHIYRVAPQMYEEPSVFQLLPKLRQPNTQAWKLLDALRANRAI